ncbi:MAG: 4Fe-4S dicluster domain-containing protein [Thermoplasmata archaeon]|nr:MAG: 4Fe-4S dicluster domain-containing protein [Thermoplasmata archaeon]
MKVIKLDPARCETCHTCEIACVLNHSDPKDIDEAMKDKPVMHQRILIITKKNKAHAQVCVNCKKPKCVDACEYEAIIKQEDGTVVLAEEKCTGCWKCIEACPFDAICKLEEKEISIKCDLCGGGDYQACVDSCPTQALFVKVSE